MAVEIQQAGHRVWLDDWEISAGDSIVGKMDEGLRGMEYLILCLSTSGVYAPWIGREWKASLAAQLNGEPVKIIPARLTGGSPPAILADIKYADLVADWKRGMADLLRAIK